MPLNLYMTHVPFDEFSGDFVNFRFDINKYSNNTMFMPNLKRDFPFYRFWMHCLLPYIKQFHQNYYDMFYQLSLLCAEEDVMLRKENKLSQLTYQFLKENNIKGFLIHKHVGDLIHALNNLQVCKQELIKYVKESVEKELVPTVKYYLNDQQVLDELHRYAMQMDENEFLVFWEE
ncbi:hypothetical protein KY335_03100 [Candidatus Woesearchaeota archaeon]|nr:hypothetical protein [Candidatus Woesearchaeota archaeon]